jgi:protein Tex
MDIKYSKHIAAELNLSLKQVSSVHDLQAEGSTIPFISRYRKEATGNLDEVAIGNVIEKINYYDELEKRKQTILKTIEEAGKLTPELKKRIDDCISATELEDIYLPYKPKRKTKATIAIEKGLEPLARTLFEQGKEDPQDIASSFVNENVKDAEEALQGARDIIAEWISENEQARNLVRKLYTEGAVVASRVFSTKKEGEDAQKYRDYFEYKEHLSQSPSHRILAMRRGEKEGFLIMSITIDKTTAHEELKRIFIRSSGLASKQVETAIEDSYNRLLQPSIETEFRMVSNYY